MVSKLAKNFGRFWDFFIKKIYNPRRIGNIIDGNDSFVLLIETYLC